MKVLDAGMCISCIFILPFEIIIKKMEFPMVEFLG